MAGLFLSPFRYLHRILPKLSGSESLVNATVLQICLGLIVVGSHFLQYGERHDNPTVEPANKLEASCQLLQGDKRSGVAYNATRRT